MGDTRMKGNIHAKPPTLILTTREKRLIWAVVMDGGNASDKCIADFLANCYPEDNNHKRDPSTIYNYRKEIIAGINKSIPLV